MNLEEEIKKESIIQFDTKLSTQELFLTLKNENNNISSTFTISISIIAEEKIEEYNSHNSFIFCGSSNLKDCKYCRIESCSIVQCGNEIINETEREDQFVI